MQLIQKLQTISRITQGFIYMVASVFHFINDVELQIIPPFLPLRRTALYITGVCEFLGGLGLLIPRFQRSASWGLAALLIAIWPANIYHAVIDSRSKHWSQRRLYHIMRQPMQMVLIAWALWATNVKKDS
jgi:uncharacterized membrane protein